MGIFARILDLLFPPADTARLMKECSAEEFGALAAPQITASGAIALLPYRHPLVRAAIIETKFRKNAKAIEFLAQTLSEYCASRAEDAAAFEEARFVVVPVPLSRERFRARGYNQVEEVAKRAGLRLATDALIRVRDTPPQTSLARRARLKNMEGAFSATGPLDPAYTYIVLDDVMTTGATLAAAKAALEAAGARVELLSLAH
jgi:ComF family protein